MSAARKLQQEMDRTNKKVQEGLLEFDDIWEKLNDSDNANSKEKLETELKNKIKKLQRNREQIKCWIQNTDIKDKQFLLDARKQIEMRMEKHKEIERQVKTKAFSKEGLGRQDRLDPKELAKVEMTDFMNTTISTLQEQIEAFEAEIEEQQSGKGGRKVGRSGRIMELENSLNRHRTHIARIEQILRCLDNEALSIEDLEDISFKDMMQDYIDRSNEDPEEFEEPDDLYGELIETLDSIANTQPVVPTTLPTRIGKLEQEKEQDREREKERVGAQLFKTQFTRDSKNEEESNQAVKKTLIAKQPKDLLVLLSEKPKEAPIPLTSSSLKMVAPIATSQHKSTLVIQQEVAPSMTSLLKSEDSSSKQSQDYSTFGPKTIIESQPVQEIDSKLDLIHQNQTFNQWEQGPPDVRQAALAPTPTGQMQAQIGVPPSKTERQSMFQAIQVTNMPQPGLSTSLSDSPSQPGIEQQKQIGYEIAINASNDAQMSSQSILSNPEVVLIPNTNSLDTSQLQWNAKNIVQLTNNLSDTVNDIQQQQQQQQQPYTQQQTSELLSLQPLLQNPPRGILVHTMHLLNILDQSMRHNTPSTEDSTWERYPNFCNPCHVPIPASYPTQRLAIFDEPSFFKQQDSEVLFFAFYLQPGTYQQYLAAYELKKLSWRYHKHKQSWFQRHEKPIQNMTDYEYGNYVYFDYNLMDQQDHPTWCYRLKENFTFKYDALEDEILVPLQVIGAERVDGVVQYNDATIQEP